MCRVTNFETPSFKLGRRANLSRNNIIGPKWNRILYLRTLKSIVGSNWVFWEPRIGGKHQIVYYNFLQLQLRIIPHQEAIFHLFESLSRSTALRRQLFGRFYFIKFRRAEFNRSLFLLKAEKHWLSGRNVWQWRPQVRCKSISLSLSYSRSLSSFLSFHFLSLLPLSFIWSCNWVQFWIPSPIMPMESMLSVSDSTNRSSYRSSGLEAMAERLRHTMVCFKQPLLRAQSN